MRLGLCRPALKSGWTSSADFLTQMALYLALIAGLTGVAGASTNLTSNAEVIAPLAPGRILTNICPRARPALATMPLFLWRAFSKRYRPAALPVRLFADKV